jgi:hypothetical protein
MSLARGGWNSIIGVREQAERRACIKPHEYWGLLATGS